LAKQAGLPSTVTLSAVQRAENDCDHHGDIITSVGGLKSASNSYQFVFPDPFSNVTLAHLLDTRHQLNEDSLANAEASLVRKNRSNKADYPGGL
jgi:hypothetical protein